MALTNEQVIGLAPDAASAAAGRKLSALKNWEGLGACDVAVWGKCKGSAVYQVKVDLANFGYHCSCPSRKFPCKHVLGMLLLHADSGSSFSEVQPPDWVLEWLGKREARATKQAEKAEATASAPVDDAARQKRAEKRESRVREGLDRLEVWLKDLIRNGLAGVETKPTSFWDDQARRLVDAQAPGLAARVNRLAEIPATSSDWPHRLFGEIGQISLLVEAYRRIEALETDLAAEVRQLIGWNLTTEEVERDGERVKDEWQLVGQWVDDDGRVRTQRTWGIGAATGRTALLLQFAVGAQPFAEPIVPGSRQAGTLVFYPGASRLRARFVSRDEPPMPLDDDLGGSASIEQFLDSVAGMLARQPWLREVGGVLKDVVLAPGRPWHACDRNGDALPLFGSQQWAALAITGGAACDLAGEWNGSAFRVLGLRAKGRYQPL